MATYYVDNVQGSDRYDGRSATFQGGKNGPWKTISKVNKKKFVPGDSILFKRGGVWTDGPLKPKNGGKAGGIVTIEDSILSKPIRFELVEPKNHKSIYFGAYGAGDKPRIDCKGNKGLIIRHNYIIVEDLHLDNGGNNMLLFSREEGNFWNVVKNVDVTRCDGNAVRFLHGGGNCWLDGLYVYDYKVNGIYLQGSPDNPLKGVLVENCRVEKPLSIEWEDGISCHRDAEDNNIEGDVIIRNNTIIRSGEDGIDITSGTNILLEGNLIEHSYTAGIYVAKSRVNTVEIRGNFLNSNSINKGVGDLTIACSKVRAVNNIICGTGHHSVVLKGASEVQLWNNVVAPGERTGNFIRLRDSLNQIEFKNNIFDFSNTDQKINGAADGIVFDYNCYYGASAEQEIWEKNNFKELKAQDAAFEPNGFWADPGFADSKKAHPDHFKLDKKSPCLDKGANLPLSVDFWKNQRAKDTAMDVGAFERGN